MGPSLPTLQGGAVSWGSGCNGGGGGCGSGCQKRAGVGGEKLPGGDGASVAGGAGYLHSELLVHKAGGEGMTPIPVFPSNKYAPLWLGPYRGPDRMAGKERGGKGEGDLTTPERARGRRGGSNKCCKPFACLARTKIS